MKAVYDAAYLAIFLAFLRRLWSKMAASLTYDVPFRKEGDTGDFYVLVCGRPFYWCDDRAEALDFCYRVIGRCQSLAGQLKIVESREDMPLLDSTEIPGLCVEETLALNDTVDEMDVD